MDEEFRRKLEESRAKAKAQSKSSRFYSASGAKPTPIRPAADPDLDSMNERFAIVRIGGKTRVVAMEGSPASGGRVPVYSTIGDFTAFYTKKKLDARTGREIGIGRWWIGHESRRQFERVAYLPNQQDPDTLNLWGGFAVEPCAGDCSLFLAHARDNICAGNEQYWNYLWNWMARAVQFPGTAGETAIVMRGKEGVGKGIFAREFGKLFGPHFLHIVHARHLVGNFNSHLQQCSLLFCDEAFFAGDRAHESILKALITEPTILIEPKGLDAFAVANATHIIMSSNASWVIPAGADARRFFVIDVGDAQMQQTDYFSALMEQMRNSGREALLHLLLNHDITSFDVRAVPKTEALAEQKQYTRREVDQLIEVIAHDGMLPSAHHRHPHITITSGESSGRGFHAAARSLVPDLRRRSAVTIAKELVKQWGCEAFKERYRRGIAFPPLKDLRARFDEKFGPQTWPAGDEWEAREEEQDCAD
jgi:hypothetical protein